MQVLTYICMYIVVAAGLIVMAGKCCHCICAVNDNYVTEFIVYQKKNNYCKRHKLKGKRTLSNTTILYNCHMYMCVGFIWNKHTKRIWNGYKTWLKSGWLEVNVFVTFYVFQWQECVNTTNSNTYTETNFKEEYPFYLVGI